MKTNYILFIYILLLLHISASAGKNYYVSIGKGSDSFNGLTVTTPFKTLQKASNLTLPGDTVNIMDGTYSSTTNTILNITRAGHDGQYITYRAMKVHKPKFFASGSVWNMVIMNASYIVLDGLELEGNNANIKLTDAEAARSEAKAGGTNWSYYAQFNTNGITIGGNESLLPSHLIIRNCSIHDFPGSGIAGIKIDYLTIENNKAYNNGWYMMYGGSGISVYHLWNGDDNATAYKNFIRNNLCYNNRTNVKWIGSDDYSDGNGIIIDDNKNSQAGAPPGGAYKGRTLVENNISFNNGGSGIHAYMSSNIDMVNNTAYNNGTKVGYPEIFAGDCNNVNLMNNIMYARTGGKINDNWNNINVIYDYNLYFNGIPAKKGAHDVIADPKFVNLSIDPTVADFHLKAVSPAINTGFNQIGAETDFDGIMRPQDGTVDKGAYEYAGPTNASLQGLTGKHHPNVYPNPVSGIFFVSNPTGNDQQNVEIYNFSGSLVYKAFAASKPVSEINISRLQKGIYLVKTVAGKETDIQKIVKL